MEAKVENNVKNKRTNKQRNEKKKKHMYRLNSITEKLRKCREYWKERTYYELVPLA